MLTEFGKLLRKLRIDHETTLGELGLRVGLSAAFISAMETGRKPVPLDFLSKVQAALGLSELETNQLERAVAAQAKEVSMGLHTKSDKARELTVAFARRFESMSSEEIEKLLG